MFPKGTLDVPFTSGLIKIWSCFLLLYLERNENIHYTIKEKVQHLVLVLFYNFIKLIPLIMCLYANKFGDHFLLYENEFICDAAGAKYFKDL